MERSVNRHSFLRAELARLRRDLNHPWQSSDEWRARLAARIAEIEKELEGSAYDASQQQPAAIN